MALGLLVLNAPLGIGQKTARSRRRESSSTPSFMPRWPSFDVVVVAGRMLAEHDHAHARPAWPRPRSRRSCRGCRARRPSGRATASARRRSRWSSDTLRRSFLSASILSCVARSFSGPMRSKASAQSGLRNADDQQRFPAQVRTTAHGRTPWIGRGMGGSAAASRIRKHAVGSAARCGGAQAVYRTMQRRPTETLAERAR